MSWTPYSGGGGPVAPYFPQTTTYVAGIPTNGKGNLYSPSGKGKSNQVSRPGGMTPPGSNKGLKFM